MKASKRVAAARGAYRAGATKADLEREALELNEGLGFPATSVLVPNQHTHVVHSLREPGSPCTPYAADIAEVLRKRDPQGAAPQLGLLGPLRRCEAARAAALGRVFPALVADGGVLAVTFSTRGKRLGWSKAAAVAACARALVEAADAHGYELEGGAADGALEPNYLERLMDYTVHFGDSVARHHRRRRMRIRTNPRSTGRPRRRSRRVMGSPRLPRHSARIAQRSTRRSGSTRGSASCSAGWRRRSRRLRG